MSKDFLDKQKKIINSKYTMADLEKYMSCLLSANTIDKEEKETLLDFCYSRQAVLDKENVIAVCSDVDFELDGE